MNKVFLDANVILDLLLDREPFNDDIAEIFVVSDERSIRLCVSSLTIANVNYIVGRIEGVKKANNKTKKLLQLVDIENVGKKEVIESANSSFKDFEDGIQNFCAVESQHEIIVTRNTKDFKTSKLSILNPKEYLAKLSARL
jgi:predicted nucleic acid-binding protein